jgi:hypothetical protein
MIQPRALDRSGYNPDLKGATLPTTGIDPIECKGHLLTKAQVIGGKVRHVPPGLFAVIAAAAVLAATTHGPISAVVLIMELTGRDR